MTEVTKEVIKYTKNGFSGHFRLSDKSKTFFDYTPRHGQGAWSQWGNSTDNLAITVYRLEAIEAYWLENYFNPEKEY